LAISLAEKEFRIIYESHYSSLCRIAYRIIRENDSAREVVQEVFIEIWKKQNWNELNSVKAYLYKAVYNRSLKVLSKRKSFVSIDRIKEPYVTESKSEQQELEVLISRAINKLPDRCKEIFILSREDEMTYSQIATHLGISIKSVENQMGIALRKLRESLKRSGV
jgi:RNA polymerase sigma-70 factor (ECF subfamily)